MCVAVCPHLSTCMGFSCARKACSPVMRAIHYTLTMNYISCACPDTHTHTHPQETVFNLGETLQPLPAYKSITSPAGGVETGGRSLAGSGYNTPRKGPAVEGGFQSGTRYWSLCVCVCTCIMV